MALSMTETIDGVAHDMLNCRQVRIGEQHDLHVYAHTLEMRIAECGIPIFGSNPELVLQALGDEFDVIEKLGKGAEAEVILIKLFVGGVERLFVYRKVFHTRGLSSTAPHTAMRLLQEGGIPTVIPCIAIYDPSRSLNANLMLYGQPRYLDCKRYLANLFREDPTGEKQRELSSRMRIEMKRISGLAERILMNRRARRLIGSNRPYEVDLYRGFGDWEDSPV